MKKSAGFFMTALSAVMLLSIITDSSVPEAAAKKKVTVKKVTVTAPSGRTAYVAKGKKVRLTSAVKVKPDKKANKKVRYTSKNKKVATVSASGVVKGKRRERQRLSYSQKRIKRKKHRSVLLSRRRQ